MLPQCNVDRRAISIVIMAGTLVLLPFSQEVVGVQNSSQEDIAGTWVLDLEKSDDARKKYQESIQPDGGASRQRGGAGGIILGGRGGVGGRGGRFIERPPPPFVNDWIDAFSRITLESVDDALILQREGREPLTLIPDGRERATETDDIEEPILRKARWDDRDLLVETKLGDAVKVEEKYVLRREDGRIELRVETKISGNRIARDIKFRRVYSRDPGAQG